MCAADSATEPARPTLRRKLSFWLIMAALSVFFAEVVSGAFIYPYVHPWGILVLLPLYGLHLLVLATVVYTFGSPRLPTLLLAGVLFGLYEAYMTKVVWAPPWSDAPWRVGEVAVTETALITFFWHPVMAFIAPLLLGEALLTTSRDSWRLLPTFVRRLFGGRRLPIGMLLFMVGCGAFQSYNSPSVRDSLQSGGCAALVLGLLLLGWRRAERSGSYSLRQLLPSRRQLAVMIAWLAVMYALFGFFLRPEALPGLVGHAVVWGLYLVTILLLRLGLLRRAPPEPSADPSPAPLTWRAFAVLACAFTLTSAGLNLVPGRHDVALLAAFIPLAVTGVALYVYAGAAVLSGSRR